LKCKREALEPGQHKIKISQLSPLRSRVSEIWTPIKIGNFYSHERLYAHIDISLPNYSISPMSWPSGVRGLSLVSFSNGNPLVSGSSRSAWALAQRIQKAYPSWEGSERPCLDAANSTACMYSRSCPLLTQFSVCFYPLGYCFEPWPSTHAAAWGYSFVGKFSLTSHPKSHI